MEATKDTWLEDAHALREAALHHDHVAHMGRSPALETRGRGAPARGVALERRGDEVLARLGVVLRAHVLTAGNLAAVAAEIRQALRQRWEERGHFEPLRVELHVLDLDADP